MFGSYGHVFGGYSSPTFTTLGNFVLRLIAVSLMQMGSYWVSFKPAPSHTDAKWSKYNTDHHDKIF